MQQRSVLAREEFRQYPDMPVKANLFFQSGSAIKRRRGLLIFILQEFGIVDRQGRFYSGPIQANGTSDDGPFPNICPL